MAIPTPDPNRGAMYFDEEQGKWVYFAEEIAKAEALRKKAVKKGYNDLPYAREPVTKKEVLDLIREVLGFNSGQALPTIMDSKVTPVVVLNDSVLYKNYKYVGNLGANIFGVFTDNKGFTYCDNGEVYDKDLNLVITSLGGFEVFTYLNDGKSVVLNMNANEFYVYRYGELIFSRDISIDFSGIGNVDNMSVSSSGKFIRIHAHHPVSGGRLLFYEGVV